MMIHTFKKIRLASRVDKKRGLHFQSVTVYPNDDVYLRYYSKLQKYTNIDSLNWYSVIINDKKGCPKRWIRYTQELQEQLIQTGDRQRKPKPMPKPEPFKFDWKYLGKEVKDNVSDTIQA
ncbi:hypothetical protein [Fictibacillus enclensis]|uniref:hypothetical protein n=1 Tax=Fictibacillus enclensis TaxID=1017270 RepID=UPI0024BFFC92|nr:hypothetical protein [Fictibacillus enclensis]WHY74594.1 hypothetical protein QNH15_12090 [Fictibacillus enclensis]